MKISDRIVGALYVLRGKKGLLMMDCPYCHGVAFDVNEVIKETSFAYKAMYRCRTCGADIEESQYLVAKVNE